MPKFKRQSRPNRWDTSPTIERTALHEAGHAVLAHAVGLQVRQVTVDRQTLNGVCVVHDRTVRRLGYRDDGSGVFRLREIPDRAGRMRLERVLLVALGGIGAEVIAFNSVSLSTLMKISKRPPALPPSWLGEDSGVATPVRLFHSVSSTPLPAAPRRDKSSKRLSPALWPSCSSARTSGSRSPPRSFASNTLVLAALLPPQNPYAHPSPNLEILSSPLVRG